MRAYRSAPRLVAALVPLLPLPRSLLARTHEAFSRFGSQIGMAKQLALCAGAVGSGAIGMATGVLPSPVGMGQYSATPPAVERAADPMPTQRPAESVGRAARHPKAKRARRPAPEQAGEPAKEVEPTEAVGYEAPVEAPAPEPVATPPPAPEPSTSSGSAAGEFGP
jgi:hypothetical protein